MVEVTQEELAVLIRLKENESEKEGIASSLNNIPEEMSKIEAEFNQAEEEFHNQEESLKEHKKKYRDCESEVQLKQESVKKSDVKLLSIKNNKEYQAVLKEIEEFKKAASSLEDQMLEILFKIENEDEVVLAAEKEWQQEKVRLECKKKELDKVREEQEQKLAGLESGWEEIAATLSVKLLDEYRAVQKMVPGGQAMAAARGAVCQGCHMNIPHQLYNELHKSKSLRYCPFCHRIIYYEVVNGDSVEN